MMMTTMTMEGIEIASRPSKIGHAKSDTASERATLAMAGGWGRAGCLLRSVHAPAGTVGSDSGKEMLCEFDERLIASEERVSQTANKIKNLLFWKDKNGQTETWDLAYVKVRENVFIFLPLCLALGG